MARRPCAAKRIMPVRRFMTRVRAPANMWAAQSRSFIPQLHILAHPIATNDQVMRSLCGNPHRRNSIGCSYLQHY